MVQLSHRARFLILAFALVRTTFAAAPAEPLRAVDDRWKHIRSANFELYTHAAERESRALLHDLELLRALFMERFKFVERARLDVTLYAFRSLDDFRAYLPESMEKGEFRGFYLPQLDRAVISLAPIEDGDQGQRLVFHEYVHHLFQAVQQDPPLWFNEGMAELLAAIREDGDKLEIGHPHEGRLITLQSEKLLPLETLFTVDHDSPIYRSNDHTGVFYAESWALLHYWHFGESGLAKEAVTRFTKVASDRKLAGEIDLRRFFRECFSMDYPEMQRRLERYVSAGRYRYGREALPKIPAASTYAVRDVPRDEIRLRLAELALRVNRSSMAKFLLVDAAARDARDPRVFETLGADAMADHDEAKARDCWEQALALGTKNIAIYRELTLLESRAWFAEFDYYFRLPAPLTERLRVRLRRAIENEPAQTAPYEALAWVEAFAAQPYVPNVNLVQQAFPYLKEKPRTLLALALVRLHSGMTEEAKALLSDLDKLEWDKWTAQAAEVVRAKLEDRPVQLITEKNTAREQEVTLAQQTAGFLKWPSIELPSAP